jgi:3-oxoacyl-[acyl-carrier-protein] synthase-3
MAIRAKVIGCGAYLPERVVTNEELAKRLDTSDEWIRQRTGIAQRHIVAEGELTSDLATKAADAALAQAGFSARDLDLIVVGTSTPDHTFPATATKVQANLGMARGAAFDLQAVCSGFVYALAVADNFIRAGQAQSALVIGAETFSRILDWEDRGTCVLFGRQYKLLYVDGGPSATGTVGRLRMHGREVFRHAVINLADAIDAALAANCLTPADIDWLVPHQANQRIMTSMAERLNLPPEKVVTTIDRHANTSAASIPLALAEAQADGRIRPGQLVLVEAMGGGFTWGSALIRW